MSQLQMIRRLFSYSDWANGALLSAARTLTDDALDRPFDMGVGSLRRTLIHLYNGEFVWFHRWQEKLETPWPGEDERVSVATIEERFRRVWAERDAYLLTLTDEKLAAKTRYRDSYGNLYRTVLSDMLMQTCVHSTHHRAQAANMLRQLGAGSIELDYMVHFRTPA